MSYIPTNWKDMSVEKPRTYELQDNGDGTITLVPAFGQIYEEGTKVLAVFMNKIEQGIFDATDAIETHAARTDNPHDVTSQQVTLLPANAYSLTDPGDVYPTGITMFEVSTSAGWPGRGVVININARNIRFGQIYISNQLDGRSMRFRDYHSNGWTEFSTTLTNVGAQYIDGNKVWHDGRMRWNSAGFMEYNDGGTWRPVAGVKSVQRGYSALGDSSGAGNDANVSISSIDRNKAFVSMSMTTGTEGAISARLTSNTNLRLSYRGNYAQEYFSVAWEVIEYY